MKNSTLTLKVAKKFKANKYAIVRAWEIAKNASNAFNTDPLFVAEKGLTKPSQFFKESMKIAWVEAKAIQVKEEQELYKLHTVPKKNLSKILGDIETFIVEQNIAKKYRNETTQDVISKASTLTSELKKDVATRVFASRYSSASARSTNREILELIQLA